MEKAKVYFSDFRTVAGVSQGAKLQKLMRRAGIGEIDFEGKSADEIKVITDYLKYIEYLAKWDGKLPSVMTEGSANIMIPTNPADNN